MRRFETVRETVSQATNHNQEQPPMDLPTLKTRARPVAAGVAAVVATALVSDLYAYLHGHRSRRHGYSQGFYDGFRDAMLDVTGRDLVDEPTLIGGV